jgi:hypothetical protein
VTFNREIQAVFFIHSKLDTIPVSYIAKSKYRSEFAKFVSEVFKIKGLDVSYYEDKKQKELVNNSEERKREDKYITHNNTEQIMNKIIGEMKDKFSNVELLLCLDFD